MSVLGNSFTVSLPCAHQNLENTGSQYFQTEGKARLDHPPGRGGGGPQHGHGQGNLIYLYIYRLSSMQQGRPKRMALYHNQYFWWYFWIFLHVNTYSITRLYSYYNLTTLCLNGTLPCVVFMDVTMGDIPMSVISEACLILIRPIACGILCVLPVHYSQSILGR